MKLTSHIFPYLKIPGRTISTTVMLQDAHPEKTPVQQLARPQPLQATSIWCSWFFFLFHGEKHEGNIHKSFINSDEDEDEDQDEDDHDDGGGDLMMMMMMWWRWFDDDDDGGGDLMMMMMIMIMVMMIVILWYCDIVI